jgi:muramidase (phage lysozyme)
MQYRIHTDQLSAALESENFRAFFAVIRTGEGTLGDDGYRRMFGGDLVDDLSRHPNRKNTRRLGGKRITSTAAGVGQFLFRTWEEARAALQLPDFSARSQDLAVAYLIWRRRALDDVLAGRFDLAVRKCAKEWASLPGSPYGQPTLSSARARRVYLAAGGTIWEVNNAMA